MVYHSVRFIPVFDCESALAIRKQVGADGAVALHVKATMSPGGMAAVPSPSRFPVSQNDINRSNKITYENLCQKLTPNK